MSRVCHPISLFTWSVSTGEEISTKKPRSWYVSIFGFATCPHCSFQRKVKFPLDLDLIDIVTPDLKAKLLPLNNKLKEIEKERDERRKTRRKSKAKQADEAAVAAVTTAASSSSTAAPDVQMADASAPVDGVLEDEEVVRARENEMLQALVDPSLAADVGASPHGLYDICGSCVCFCFLIMLADCALRNRYT